MIETNILEKINLIFSFLKDNVLISLIMLLILVIIMDLTYGKNKKETKTLYIITIILLLIYLGFSFYKPLLNIFDVYITNIFKISYFPTIIDYVSMFLITILIQIFSLKKKSGFTKHMNLWIGIILEVLFIVNLIALNGIKVDLTTLTSIYENDLLLSIYQLTGIIFMIWIIINILIFIVSLYLDNKIELPKLSNDYE